MVASFLATIYDLQSAPPRPIDVRIKPNQTTLSPFSSPENNTQYIYLSSTICYPPFSSNFLQTQYKGPKSTPPLVANQLLSTPAVKYKCRKTPHVSEFINRRRTSMVCCKVEKGDCIITGIISL